MHKIAILIRQADHVLQEGLSKGIDEKGKKLNSHLRYRNRNMRLYFLYCLMLSIFAFLVFHDIVFPNKFLSILPIHKTDQSPLRLQYTLWNNSTVQLSSQTVYIDRCHGKRVYMYDLPSKFNTDLLGKCHYGVVSWLSFCSHASNDGLGQSHENVSAENSMGEGWYNTDAYMLEIIFHTRMRRYSCLTNDSDAADAFFVPYYTGIDALHYLYGKNKSEHANKHGQSLVWWLERNESSRWQRHGGRDHFMVMGRTAWDFVSNAPLGDIVWGTGIYNLPHFSNMSTLLIEKQPWVESQQAVPYPTSFHPSFSELQRWLRKVENSSRPFLFAFAGGMRSTMKDTSIRARLQNQCLESKSCIAVDCGKLKCSHNPKPIADSFLQAEFCLQPRGDTPTRRSAFDAMVAGCIPVFFHEDSAYSQYTWHLPKESSSYSVYIPEEEIRKGVQIETLLMSYSKQQIKKMRSKIIEMIPNLLYINPSSSKESFEVIDAFDITLAGLLQRVSKLKQQTRFL